MIKNFLFLALCLIFLSSNNLMAGVADSLRVEYIDGQAYIIHQIDAGETLYAISRRYNSSMNAIADANPQVRQGLSDNMIIKVPFKLKPQTESMDRIHEVMQGETLYSISRIYDVSVVEIMEWNDLLSSDLEIGQKLKIGGKPAPTVIDFERNGLKIHIVQASEGLYAVARKYNVSVDELVEWNNLETSSLNLGQEIIVGKLSASPVEEKASKPVEVVEEPVAKSENLPVVAESAAVVAAVVPSNKNNEDSAAMIIPVEMRKVIENGIAAEIEGSTNDKSYLALHRSIPVGSLVAVQNEMNNQVVFVRIVGKLPDTGVNDKIIIRLSKSAVDQLGAIDPKFRVEVSYLVPK